ncbi:hypothetical protein [Ralstonia syzygii]|uniref:hypothetical protein n=1 Tax=Ralstonia syzygii TaxID=28097 RepID=UPI001E40D3A0
MRDVTDNVTGDLPGVEMKRGRGRPRKAHAMSNAERQAAFRARRKAEQPADRSVTVTKMPAEVDAYDECRLEVDALRAELAGLRRQVELAEGERNKAFELADLKCDQHLEALAEVQRLKRVVESERALANRAMKNPVTSNAKGPSAEEWIALVAVAMKGKTQKTRNALHDTAEYDAVLRACWNLDAQRRALRVAVLGQEVVARSEGLSLKL